MHTLHRDRIHSAMAALTRRPPLSTCMGGVDFQSGTQAPRGGGREKKLTLTSVFVSALIKAIMALLSGPKGKTGRPEVEHFVNNLGIAGPCNGVTILKSDDISGGRNIFRTTCAAHSSLWSFASRSD